MFTIYYWCREKYWVPYEQCNLTAEVFVSVLDLVHISEVGNYSILIKGIHFEVQVNVNLKATPLGTENQKIKKRDLPAPQ